MTRGRWLLVACLALSAGGACGGEAVEPLLGVWQVDVHTHDGTGCQAAIAASEPAYVQVLLSPVLDHEVLELVDCTTPTTCAASAGVLGRLYPVPLPTGFRAETFTAFGDANDCALAARRSDALLGADGVLRIETRRYETRDLDGVVCAPATARTMLGSLTCLELDVIAATAVTPAP